MSLFEVFYTKNYSGNMFKTCSQMIPEKKKVFFVLFLQLFLEFEIILKLTLSLAFKKYIYFIVYISLQLIFSGSLSKLSHDLEIVLLLLFQFLFLIVFSF